MHILIVLLPVAFGITLAFGPVWAWIALRKRRTRTGARRHPMKEPLLRPPGYSLGQRAENALAEAMLSLVCVPLVVVLIFAAHAAQTAYLGHEEGVLRVLISVAGAGASSVWLLLRARKSLLTHRDCRLGWEGEVAVAEALQPLAARGFRVFHDVPAKGFNVDHVVVGPTGVFAVETKARIKRSKDRNAHRLIYDGQKLHFPDYATDKPLEQARAQARWLSDFLSSAVAKPLKVQPVLCIPGWWIERKKWGDVVVQSAKACDKYFDGPHLQRILDEQTIGMIGHQLEQRCRDVALGESLL